MRKGDFSDFAVFIAVAEEGSFTRAAAKLGLSQSAISYTVRMLEQRLETRLLSRTTRSLSLTDAGEHLLKALKHAFEFIDHEIAALSSQRGKPAGTIRITTFRHAARTILLPALTSFLNDYPDIVVEINVNEGLTDIVAGRFDAGIRMGEQVQKDMIAVRISPDIRMAVVGSASYFSAKKIPITPRELNEHQCVSYRQSSGGGLYAWEFEKEGDTLEVRINGSLIINDNEMLEDAALSGLGLVYTFESHVIQHITDGRLIRVLGDWCPPVSGYHLYYPSRKQHTSAFALLIDTLRYKG